MKLSTESLQSLQSTLDYMVVGTNYWFMTSINEHSRHLLLSSTLEDRDGRQILSTAASINPPLDNIKVGFATYTSSGFLRFASETDDPSFVTDLIEAVQAQGSVHRFLYHLVGAEFVYRSKTETKVVSEGEQWAGCLSYDLAKLSSVLGSVAPGERLWASFQEKAVDCPLILLPMGSDPGQRQFRMAIQGNTVDGELPPIGFAEWNGKQLNIFLDRPSKGIMKSFFMWLTKAIKEYPTLSRLYQAQIYRLQPEGQIRSAPMKMEAWNKIDVAEQNHQMHSLIAAALSNIQPEDMFWMLYNIDEGLLVLSSAVLDPDRAILSQRWNDVAFGEDIKRYPGIAVVTPTLGFVMMVGHPKKQFRSLLINIAHNAAAYPATQQIIHASIQPFLGGDDLGEPQSEHVDEAFSGLNAILSSAQEGQEYWFWFAEKTKDNSPILALFDVAEDPSRKQVKAWVSSAPKAKNVVLGKSIYKEGIFLFKGRDPSNEFLEILSGWVKENAEKCLSLARLKNSMYLFKDKKSGKSSIQKNDSLWS